MTVLYPSEAISRRWEGALDARKRHAPLEVFLRTHRLKVSTSGASRITDNVIRTTIYMVGRTFAPTDTIDLAQQAGVATIACAICHELTSLIGEPGAWRIAALVSAAELLSAGIPRKNAAIQSAAAARGFVVMLQSRALEPTIERIGIQAALAVRSNLDDDLASAGRLITTCLSNRPEAAASATSGLRLISNTGRSESPAPRSAASGNTEAF